MAKQYIRYRVTNRVDRNKLFVIATVKMIIRLYACSVGNDNNNSGVVL